MRLFIKENRTKVRGQALVETVIVLPLFIFIVLGLIQMTQVYQANSMLKYAAYRAARTGALNNMDQKKMLQAGLITMLPVDTSSGSIKKVDTTTIALASRLPVINGSLSTNASGMLAHLLAGERQMRLFICGPSKTWVQNNFKRAQDGEKGSGEVDFDDPRNTYGASEGEDLAKKQMDTSSQKVVENFERTKLKIQLQYRHRLVIPLVNSMIYRIYKGKKVADVFRLNKKRGWMDDISDSVSSIADGHIRSGVYSLPMYANYALRMQSNFLIDNLPSSDGGDCLYYAGEGH